VATALLDGPPDLSAFEASTLDRADIAAPRRRVDPAVGDPYASAYPAHHGAAVAVRLRDGRAVRAAVSDALGDPEQPLVPAAVESKARMLMEAAGLDSRRIEAIIERAGALAGGGSLSALTMLLP
jgi:2-methylcitrate dehydratase PrpD